MTHEQFIYWFLGAAVYAELYHSTYSNTENINSIALVETIKQNVKNKVDFTSLTYMINGYYEMMQVNNRPYDTFDKEVIKHLKLIFTKVTPAKLDLHNWVFPVDRAIC